MNSIKYEHFVRRCKKATGTEVFKTVHIADCNTTACGKDLNSMWWIESSAGMDHTHITCGVCKRKFYQSANNS